MAEFVAVGAMAQCWGGELLQPLGRPGARVDHGVGLSAGRRLGVFHPSVPPGAEAPAHAGQGGSPPTLDVSESPRWITTPRPRQNRHAPTVSGSWPSCRHTGAAGPSWRSSAGFVVITQDRPTAVRRRARIPLVNPRAADSLRRPETVGARLITQAMAVSGRRQAVISPVYPQKSTALMSMPDPTRQQRRTSIEARH